MHTIFTCTKCGQIVSPSEMNLDDPRCPNCGTLQDREAFQLAKDTRANETNSGIVLGLLILAIICALKATEGMGLSPWWLSLTIPLFLGLAAGTYKMVRLLQGL